MSGCGPIWDGWPLWNHWLNPTKTIAVGPDTELVSIFQQVDPMESYRETVPNAEPPTLADLEWTEEDYRLGAGDIVTLSVLDLYGEGQEVRFQRFVSNEGYVQLPLLANRVRVADLTAGEALQAVIDAYSPEILVEPLVSLEIAARRQSYFSIMGAVARPGTYEVPRKEFRLLEALTMSGDVAQPGLDYVYVIRQTPATEAFRRTTDERKPPPEVTDPEDLPSLPGTEEKPLTDPKPPARVPDDDIPDELKPFWPGKQSPPAPESTPPTVAPASPAAPSAPREPATVPADEPSVESDLDELRKAMPPGAARPATRPVKPTAVRLNEMTRVSGGSPVARLHEPAPKWEYRGSRWVRTSDMVAGPAGGQASGQADAATVDGVLAQLQADRPSRAEGSARQIDEEDPFGWAQAEMQHLVRVIAVDLNRLKEASARQNIIVRDGDTIIVPRLKVGQFYVMGEVFRPGAYDLTGRKMTVKMALASAGGFGELAWPSNCILIRRIGKDQELRVPLRLDKIMAGEDADIFLRPDDMIAVGTHVAAPFLAVARNAFRMTYGFGFIYDRNFGETNFGQDQSLHDAADDFFGY